VLGPVPAGDLGATSMHEHLLFDAGALRAQQDPGPPVTAATAAALREDIMSSADNLRLREPALAAEELGASGLGTVVDLTVWGFGGPAPELPAVSRAAGVHVVAGVGAYLGRTHPDWLAALDADALAATFVRALTDRLPGCSHRAGIVGVVAASDPASPSEQRALRAAGAAAAATGAAVVVRVDPRVRHGLALLDALAAEGVAPDRVVLSNVDGLVGDPAHLRELAGTGATLKWCFGYESPPRAGMVTATDAARADAIAALLADGARQVLACGIWTKTALAAFGGHGLGHLLGHAVPLLRERGLTAEQIDRLLAGEPRRLLSRTGARPA
jgi:phosphotriesterase-related protein